MQPCQSLTATAAATKLAVERAEPVAVLQKETEIPRVGVPEPFVRRTRLSGHKLPKRRQVSATNGFLEDGQPPVRFSQ